ncbi:PIN domain-containing protein [Fibrella arboris]|uniref:PIN domain-containing protein n=1 Tax=Fibrella arboris TaxID=3242486 RepID=UPI003521317C
MIPTYYSPLFRVGRRIALFIDALIAGAYEAYVSTDVLMEYTEKIAQFFDHEVAEDFLGGLLLLPHVYRTEIYFNLALIEADKDDNKFVDCAFSANVQYLVTNDRHFNVLRQYDFPKINLIRADEFTELLRATIS